MWPLAAEEDIFVWHWLRWRNINPRHLIGWRCHMTMSLQCRCDWLHTQIRLLTVWSLIPPGVCRWNVAASKNSINSCLLHPLSQERSKAITRSGYLSDSGRTQKIYEMISLIKKEVRKWCSHCGHCAGLYHLSEPGKVFVGELLSQVAVIIMYILRYVILNYLFIDNTATSSLLKSQTVFLHIFNKSTAVTN